MPGNERLERSAANIEWLLAQVLAVELEQVVDHEAHRCFSEQLRARFELADPLLQGCEGQWSFAVGRPGEDLAVENAAVRQVERYLFDFREAAIEAFLATR